MAVLVDNRFDFIRMLVEIVSVLILPIYFNAVDVLQTEEQHFKSSIMVFITPYFVFFALHLKLSVVLKAEERDFQVGIISPIIHTFLQICKIYVFDLM